MDDRHVDDRVLDDLVRQTLELEDFERDVDRAAAPFRLHSAAGVASRSSWSRPWVVGSGLAAAAALTFALVLVTRNPSPAPGPMAVSPVDSVPERGPMPADATSLAQADVARSSVVPVAHTVSDDDIQQFAFLDPEIAHGLPDLTSERSLVLAVYQTSPDQAGAGHECDCLSWSVETPGDWEATKGQVIERAMSQPCAAHATGLTLVKVTGPRVLLPFHDDDAREIARCVPSSDCDAACAHDAASQCLPTDLRVQTREINWALR